MKSNLWQKHVLTLIIGLCGIMNSGCDSTESDDPRASAGDDKSRIYVVSPAVSPEGVGVDLETDSSYSLDSTAIPIGWAYDIRLKTIKGVTASGTSKGCPHIKLYKTITTAYQYALTGKSAYNAITQFNVQEAQLAADAVEEIDDTAVTNTNGKYDYTLLMQYYENNLVTKNSENWRPSTWTIGEDEVIFIIKTEEGNYFKLIVLGMGTTSGSMPGSGSLELMFEKL
jgi:hypothetical protein